VTAATDRIYDTDLLDVLSTRVIVGDGAMGTQPQAADRIRDLAQRGTAIAKRVGVDRGDELVVQTSIG